MHPHTNLGHPNHVLMLLSKFGVKASTSGASREHCNIGVINFSCTRAFKMHAAKWM